MTTLTPRRDEKAPAEHSPEAGAGLDREQERCLVQRAINRDAAAFADLYDRYVVRVYRHIYYMVDNRNEAEDLTAQTFLKAWEAIGRYTDRGVPISAWFLRIAHNLTISHLRSRRPHSELEDHYVDEKRGGNPEAVLEQSCDELIVREAVLRLRDQQRQVIMLRFVEEMDYREVAAVLGKTVPVVRVIQHRALGELRKLMAEAR